MEATNRILNQSGLTQRSNEGSEHSKAPFVSVIIPVYNNAQGLKRCLDALSRQTYPGGRFEIIVIDNGSDEELTHLGSLYPNAVWLVEKNKGSYRSRNKGILYARGEVLAFTDSDCVPHSTWLEYGVRAVLASDLIGLAAGEVEIVFKNSQRPTICEIYDRMSSLQQDEAIKRAWFGATSNLFTTRRILDKVGLFNGSLMSGGDREWGNRVHDLGFWQIYCAKAVVLHPARRTMRDLLARSLRITAATMVAGPDARFSKQYLFRHIIERPRAMWQRMSELPYYVRPSIKATVIILYFLIKTLQLGERVKVKMGCNPRR